MIDWYRELDTAERRTFWACFGGWALDALDVQIYSFVVPALIALWRITNAQAGLLATSALVISAFGGWLAGMLRTASVAPACCRITFAGSPSSPSCRASPRIFGQLLLVRGLQGLGFGGEWAAGSVLIGEVIRGQRPRRGRRHGAERLGRPRLGRGGDPRYRHLLGLAAGDRVAGDVLGRHPAGAARFLYPQRVPEPAIFDRPRPIRRGGAAPSRIFRRDLLGRPSSPPSWPPARRAAITPSRPGCPLFSGPSGI